MKPRSSWKLCLFTLIAIVCSCESILTGQETYSDLTENPAFGCRWFGGSASTLSCNCRTENEEEFFIQENSIPSYDTETISISDCKKIRFGSKSISSMRNLRFVNLINIQSLQLDDSSLQWQGYVHQSEYNPQWDNIPSLQILIENTNIEEISSYTFKGQIKSVTLRNVKIGYIAPFAFSSLELMEKIDLQNVEIRNIQPQAFKKFGTTSLRLEEVVVNLLPSRSFSDVSVTNTFLISNSSFDTIKPGAFLIYNPSVFEVRNSRINTLSGEGFKVTASGNVDFRNNIFNVTNSGAFRGITLNQNEPIKTKVLTFDSNVFNSLTTDSLVTVDFETHFVNTIINEKCDCKYFYGLLKYSEFYDEIKCIDRRDDHATIRDYKKFNCTIMSSHGTLIIAIGVALILFIILGSVFVWYLKRVRNSDKYGDDKTANGKNAQLNLIVPDGRTYRETELHVIVERADLLTTDL